ncbi:YugN-like protein [Salsuginibacillus halophilus]|uniref:YugN-like protein n=1 Tax=Salsuginibacillus halophilus TaxID=517424 RepID=A0A2P8HE30_9BACI|nr:YugN family protein [Salsuginibacillus halophilus]PSL44487.1 YugN-like protein [Salsuginibacillus halophilus]
METLDSRLAGRRLPLKDIEETSKRYDFRLGGGWEYDHGYLDHKLDTSDGVYYFLRVPLTPVDGTMEDAKTLVELGTPFVLAHAYEDGIDEEADHSNALVNQFSAPEDEDAEVPEEMKTAGEKKLQALAAAIH